MNDLRLRHAITCYQLCKLNAYLNRMNWVHCFGWALMAYFFLAVALKLLKGGV